VKRDSPSFDRNFSAIFLSVPDIAVIIVLSNDNRAFCRDFELIFSASMLFYNLAAAVFAAARFQQFLRKRYDMKKLFSLLLCAVMVLSLVACGSKTDDNQTNDEPESTAPELSGTMKVVATGDVYGPLFDAFTADTGVQVECLSMSSGEVLSKLRAEGGVPSADLWFGGGIDAFMSAKDDGLLEPVMFDAASELGDEFKDAEGYWYSKGITIVGFLLNNSLMEELGLTAPESWDDLTDSQYAGEIVMSNPAVSGTNYAVVNALLQAKGDEGWNYFEALNNNIAYYGKRGSDPKNKVSAGEFAVGITYIDASIEQAAEENDLTIVYPADGMPWVPEGVAVFKNAENVDAAKYFVEWLFSSDDHLRQLAEIEQKSGIKVIKPSIEDLELSYDPTLLMTEDLSLFGSQRSEILERFEPLMGDKAATE